MLSDEEEILIKKLRYCEQEYEQNGYLSVGKFEAIKEAINLIEKQSKEIEELKNADLTTVYLNGVYDGEKKVKDKIKAKIEEYKKQQKEEPDAYLCIKVLQSLLEKE